MASQTPNLAVNMPLTTPSTKKVFCHYVSWTEISRDNAPQPDTWQTAYINPDGEGGVHAAYGGYWRDRPAIRPPLPGTEEQWRATDCQTDCSQAKSGGVDGFIVDVAGSGQLAQLGRLQAAAAAVGNFVVIPMADMSSSTEYYTMSSTTFANTFKPYLTHPNAYRLADGRAVIMAFHPDSSNPTPTWWANTIAAFHNIGVEVAFVPTFLGNPGSDVMSPYAAVAYGYGNWGNRTAQGQGDSSMANAAHALGRIFMTGVRYQDNRPYSGLFGESTAGSLIRAAWNVAAAGDWVQLITWNDHAETSGQQVSEQHHWGILDVQAWQLAGFKWGTPTVARDALYVAHRKQFVNPGGGYTYPETQFMTPVDGIAPVDIVEVTAYAKRASKVSLTVGSSTTSHSVPAGFSTFTVPLGLGNVSAKMTRGLFNRTFAAVTSPASVTNTPYVQDMEYVVSGSLR